ncbi:phage tail protein [Humibacter albus]|jgi:microcystin-dependent protein|uniref:phage tail protein n=1 Tax=Humibacter albus TaxID=427754 RepID=UPI0003B72E42|nr:tail fiber protein [Humibacter albus]
MSDPYLGEIRLVSFSLLPKGWALCNGQILAINQNEALYSLLGTSYGGDGRTTFALPDLRARIPRGYDASRYAVGSSGGEAAHTLTVPEMAAHTHTVAAGANAAQASPAGAVWGTTAAAVYQAAAPNTAMNAASISDSGGSQPHENRSPYLGLQFVIATQGIFPTRN